MCRHTKRSCPTGQDLNLAYNHLSVRRANTLLSITQPCVTLYSKAAYKAKGKILWRILFVDPHGANVNLQMCEMLINMKASLKCATRE